MIIARYKPKDPLYEASEKLFKTPNLTLYISPLTVLELYSVLSRVKLEVPTEKLAINSMVHFIIKDCKLNVISIPLMAKRSIAGHETTIPIEYDIAMKLSHKLKLRTLDLIHLAYASLLKRKGIADMFITGDKEILECREEILIATGILVKDPLNLE
ncbi:MAG: PIN domain-containing protein [Candidatus Verstraetearchaeota archaeon]|nr:PIN domain-containing protein [Candidatus Verstraetearchaeota archaeon]